VGLNSLFTEFFLVQSQHRSCNGQKPCDRCMRNGRASVCSYSDDEASPLVPSVSTKVAKPQGKKAKQGGSDEMTMSSGIGMIKTAPTSETEVSELKRMIALLQNKIQMLEPKVQSQDAESTEVLLSPNLEIEAMRLSTGTGPRLDENWYLDDWDGCPDFFQPTSDSLLLTATGADPVFSGMLAWLFICVDAFARHWKLGQSSFCAISFTSNYADLC
jgi:hypothetical protein